MKTDTPAGNVSSEQHSSIATPVVRDEARVMARVGGDVALLAELLDMFHADRARWVAELRAALSSGDAPALAAGAHKMIGSVGMFECERGVALGREIERRVARSDLGSIAPLLDAADEVLGLLDAELEAIVNRRARR